MVGVGYRVSGVRCRVSAGTQSLNIYRASRSKMNNSRSVNNRYRHSAPDTRHPITLLRAHVEEMYAHAREASPSECCGLIGGASEGRACSIYRLRNVASDPLIAYEAAPKDLFAAQRLMRERGEQLLGIYHSHPRSADPAPSETDVRLAYYPSATYFIIGLEGEAIVRAFRLSEKEGRWERARYEIA